MGVLEIRNLVESRFTLERVERGSLLFHEGGPCSAVPFLREGELKVYLLSETGRELTLYRVLPGQMCILAMLTAYSGKEYPAYTRVEKDSSVYMVPSEVALKWFEEQPQWRYLFMKVLSENLLSLLSMVNTMVSERVEKRLACYLLSQADERGLVEKTHEDIAKDVGSVRVVVSRVLKEFEREGLVDICRGRLVIKNQEALRKRAGNAHP
ncbi:MAG: Crp/Fnr family transcriptional regulator [Aquificaceae bacterium]|nr:Crp/Fnr family transcriptional regulator [Aquificaceae bacterium]